METVQTFVFFMVAAILVEAVVNIIENVRDKETAWQYWASLILGLAISILVAVNWDLDLFKMVGFPQGRLPFVGAVITGIVLSRGSNYLSDLLSRINTF